jgi:D-glycero-beta-D-manno-heptose-7-phosphate kinase
MQNKFGFLIESENIQPQKSLRVLLIGESCIDEYRYGECRRLSPEAPVPVFDFSEVKEFPGMAANVKQNLESFGVEVDFITNNPKELIKRRFVEKKSRHQIMREDIGHSVNPMQTPWNLDYDALVFSDYEKGLIPWDVARDLCSAFKGPIFVDSKKLDLSCYNGSIIKINQYEAEESLCLTNDSELIITRGSEGAEWSGIKFPAPKVDLYDVSGAGDVFLSTLVYFCRKKTDIPMAIRKAVILSTKSVSHSGTYKITQKDIEELL